MSPSETTWLSRRESGTTLGIRFVVGLASALGRRAARGFVRFLMLYYVAFDANARRASRSFLDVALGRKARFREVLTHLTTFGLVTLDRIFFLQGRRDLFSIEAKGSEHLDALTRDRRGALLLGAHLGSFESLRARGSERGHDLHVLAYFENAKKINDVLAAIDPEMQSRVIGLGTVDAMLRAREVVEAGGMLAMLGDRVGLADKTIAVEFLGRQASFPTGPFLLASILRCPVYLVFGVYLGENRYRLSCEPFAERIDLPRRDREAALRSYIERYADAVAAIALEHPMNWFNLYDFWARPTPAPEASPPAPHVADDRGVGYIPR